MWAGGLAMPGITELTTDLSDFFKRQPSGR